MTSTGFAVSYDAARNRYYMDFPSPSAGYFFVYDASTPNDRYWNGVLAWLDQTQLHEEVFVLKPSNPDLQLSYTTLVHYDIYYGDQIPFGFAAFGTATLPSAMPVTGSASYSALVRGGTVNGAGGIEGTAALQFNFGAGTLAGQMTANYYPYDGVGDLNPLGQYNFVNTVYSTGSTTFSGQLSNSAVAGLGSFNGQFTGPAGQELMSSWSAPYTFDGLTSTMFGVWVGKKN